MASNRLEYPEDHELIAKYNGPNYPKGGRGWLLWDSTPNEVHDFLFENGVWLSGFTGEKANPAAYMSTLEYKKLESIWEELCKKFSIEDLRYTCYYWHILHRDTFLPILKITALMIESKLGKEIVGETIDHSTSE